jgi:hypothetical protein
MRDIRETRLCPQENPSAPEPAAAPAGDQLDQAFIDALRKGGVPVNSEPDAIGLAHSTCQLLDQGKTLQDGLRHVHDATGWPEENINTFVGIATYAYCRDKNPSAAQG